VESRGFRRLEIAIVWSASTEEPALFNRNSTRLSHGRRVSWLENSRRLHRHVECLVNDARACDCDAPN